MSKAPSCTITNGARFRPVVEHNRVNGNNNRASVLGRRADLLLVEWLNLLVAYKFRCAYCGRLFETMDHIISISQGGGTTYTNVAPCCADCNNAKGTAVWLPARAGELPYERDV